MGKTVALRTGVDLDLAAQIDAYAREQGETDRAKVVRDLLQKAVSIPVRTNAEKREAVETLLANPESAQWGNREIARRCGVSDPFVGAVRKQLEDCSGFTITQRSPRGDWWVGENDRPLIRVRYSYPRSFAQKVCAALRAAADCGLLDDMLESGHVTWLVRDVDSKAVDRWLRATMQTRERTADLVALLRERLISPWRVTLCGAYQDAETVFVHSHARRPSGNWRPDDWQVRLVRGVRHDTPPAQRWPYALENVTKRQATGWWAGVTAPRHLNGNLYDIRLDELELPRLVTEVILAATGRLDWSEVCSRLSMVPVVSPTGKVRMIDRRPFEAWQRVPAPSDGSVQQHRAPGTGVTWVEVAPGRFRIRWRERGGGGWVSRSLTAVCSPATRGEVCASILTILKSTGHVDVLALCRRMGLPAPARLIDRVRQGRAPESP